MMEFHKVFLPEKTIRMRTPILILMHTMPMTRMYTLILLKTITVTLPWPPMVKIDLNCRIMKAKQVINPELRHPKKNKMTEFNKVFLPKKIMKAKQEINSLEKMKIMLITMLRTITMMVMGPCRWHPIFPHNSTQRTSTRYWVST